MKSDGQNNISTLSYNDTMVISTTNQIRIEQQEVQHRNKKKKARFFEQFCKYRTKLQIICLNSNYKQFKQL